jgi:hypothetical protein
MPAGDIIEARIVCVLLEQRSFNVLHVRRVTTVGGDVSLQAVANTIDLNLANAVKALLVDDATYEGIDVAKIRPLPRTIRAAAGAGAGAGGVVGEPLPRQVAGLISYFSDLAGRSQRGRTYVPFPGEPDNVTGTGPTNSYLTRLGTLGSLLITDFGVTEGGASNTFRWVIFHRPAGNFTDIIGRRIRSGWATQRRRGTFAPSTPITPIG